MNNDTVTKIGFALLLMLIAFPPAAHAYIDPSVGSYVIQILVGFLFATIYVVQEFLGNCKKDGVKKAIEKQLEKRLEKTDFESNSGNWRLESSQSLP